jgi:hypothetical protein
MFDDTFVIYSDPALRAQLSLAVKTLNYPVTEVEVTLIKSAIIANPEF